MAYALFTGTRQLEMPILERNKRRRGVGRDPLPEHAGYKDDGCSVSPSCLSCPLPRCRYEEKGGLRGMMLAMRDEELLQARIGGASIDDLATQFRVSKRTVFRILGEHGRGVRKTKQPLSIETYEHDQGRRPTVRNVIEAAVQTAGYVLATAARHGCCAARALARRTATCRSPD